MPLLIHLHGRWPHDRVTARLVASTWAPTADLLDAVDREWGAAEASARATGRSLFDGPMARLESATITPTGTLDITISRTSYRPFYVLHILRPQLLAHRPQTQQVRPIGVSVALRTADDKLVMGRRSHRVAYFPGWVHPLAGALEPDEGGDLFAAATRELSEEVGLGEGELQALEVLGLIEDPDLLQPEFVLGARTPVSVAELRRRLDKAEHESLVEVPASSAGVEQALAGTERFTPVCRGMMELWARAYASPTSR